MRHDAKGNANSYPIGPIFTNIIIETNAFNTTVNANVPGNVVAFIDVQANVPPYSGPNGSHVPSVAKEYVTDANTII